MNRGRRRKRRPFFVHVRELLPSCHGSFQFPPAPMLPLREVPREVTWMRSLRHITQSKRDGHHGPLDRQEGNNYKTGKNGAPGRIRTSDLVLRRHTLYPAELRARGMRPARVRRTPGPRRTSLLRDARRIVRRDDFTLLPCPWQNLSPGGATVSEWYNPRPNLP